MPERKRFFFIEAFVLRMVVMLFVARICFIGNWCDNLSSDSIPWYEGSFAVGKGTTNLRFPWAVDILGERTPRFISGTLVWEGCMDLSSVDIPGFLCLQTIGYRGIVLRYIEALESCLFCQLKTRLKSKCRNAISDFKNRNRVMEMKNSMSMMCASVLKFVSLCALSMKVWVCVWGFSVPECRIFIIDTEISSRYICFVFMRVQVFVGL